MVFHARISAASRYIVPPRQTLMTCIPRQIPEQRRAIKVADGLVLGDGEDIAPQHYSSEMSPLLGALDHELATVGWRPNVRQLPDVRPGRRQRRSQRANPVIMQPIMPT